MDKFDDVLLHELHVNHAFYMNAVQAFLSERGQLMTTQGTTIDDIIEELCTRCNIMSKDRLLETFLHLRVRDILRLRQVGVRLYIYPFSHLTTADVSQVGGSMLDQETVDGTAK